MITIFSFIPNNYIKYDNSGNRVISLFSSIKTSILNQAYTKWELLLVTNIENVLWQQDQQHDVDERIKIVYTPDSYLNLNTLFKLTNNNNNHVNNDVNNVINPQCKYGMGSYARPRTRSGGTDSLGTIGQFNRIACVYV